MKNNESISSIVKDIIFMKPCIIEAMIKGYANYSALSRILYKEIKKHVKNREIKTSTLKISLIRQAEKIRKQKINTDHLVEEVISNSTLTIIDKINVITVKHLTFRQLEILLKIFEKSRFYHFTQGIGEITIMSDHESFKEILKIIPKESMLYMLQNQSAVILTSPQKIIFTPGVIAYLTSLLAIRKINISQIISCHRDTIFIVNRKNAMDVYKILQDLIEKIKI